MHEHDHSQHAAHTQHSNRTQHPAHSESGHGTSFNKHAGHNVLDFRNKFWVSLLLTIPIVLYSETIQQLLRFEMPTFPGSDWIGPVLGSLIFFYGGLIFIRSAWHELRSRLPGMMTLIALAIISAYVYSLLTTFFISGTEFFWELATLITVMLFGHWQEMRAVNQTQGALKQLAKLLPDTAERIDPKTNAVQKVAVNDLGVSDIVLVRPGAKVPADGVVAEGESSVDESIITGESRAIHKKVGQKVIAGSVNGSGALRVRVTNVGEETALAGIMRLVAQAQASRSRAQILADRAALLLTIMALVVGAATFAIWASLETDWAFALERTVTVLVIACPHALGLAVPLVTTISTTLAARQGILVRERLALESARSIDVVLFDKTGTLTRGQQGVSDIYPFGGLRADEVLQMAASAESSSEHIIGRAIVAYAAEKKIKLLPARDFRAIAGQGVDAEIAGRRVSVGTSDQGVSKTYLPTPEENAKIKDAGRSGKTVVFVMRDGKTVGAIALADVVRPESREAVTLLQKMGVRVAMLTGDSEDVATWVAKELGIKEYFAQIKPDGKAAMVKKLQQDGSRVAMVGDGVNDAPALTQADIGVAIGAGTDVAIESAGIVLIKNDPRDLVKIIKLSRGTFRKMQQNLLWATGYNVIAIPLAAGVLASAGFLLPPALGALFMSASTVIVAINAQALRRLRL